VQLVEVCANVDACSGKKSRPAEPRSAPSPSSYLGPRAPQERHQPCRENPGRTQHTHHVDVYLREADVLEARRITRRAVPPCPATPHDSEAQVFTRGKKHPVQYGDRPSGRAHVTAGLVLSGLPCPGGTVTSAIPQRRIEVPRPVGPCADAPSAFRSVCRYPLPAALGNRVFGEN